MQKLAETVTPDEQLKLEPREVLKRLFWQENPQMGTPRAPKFECGCSRDRVGGMIRALGEEDALALVEEQGKIEVTCEFCGKTYAFDPIDVHQLFDEHAAKGHRNPSLSSVTLTKTMGRNPEGFLPISFFEPGLK